MMNILIIEDDRLMLEGLVCALENEGYSCDTASSVSLAEQCIFHEKYALIIMDLGLPDGDGIDFLLRLRRKRVNVPVLIISARESYTDRALGLDSGADDYMVKPFALREFLARVRALLRRNFDNNLTVESGDLLLNAATQQVWYEGETIELTPKEYIIFSRLMVKPGQPVHRETLYNELDNYASETSRNTLEVHIYNLRVKIGKNKIQTLRGFGYVLLTDGDDIEDDPL